jgi:hypothetical protein
MVYLQQKSWNHTILVSKNFQKRRADMPQLEASLALLLRAQYVDVTSHSMRNFSKKARFMQIPGPGTSKCA